jgi:hypothetical protein
MRVILGLLLAAAPWGCAEGGEGGEGDDGGGGETGVMSGSCDVERGLHPGIVRRRAARASGRELPRLATGRGGGRFTVGHRLH